MSFGGATTPGSQVEPAVLAQASSAVPGARTGLRSLLLHPTQPPAPSTPGVCSHPPLTNVCTRPSGCSPVLTALEEDPAAQLLLGWHFGQTKVSVKGLEGAMGLLEEEEE